MQYEILPMRRKTLHNQLYIHNKKKHTLVRLFIYIKNYAFLWMFGQTASQWDFIFPTEITLVNILWWHYLTRKLLRFQKSTEVLLISTEVATEKYLGPTENTEVVTEGTEVLMRSTEGYFSIGFYQLKKHEPVKLLEW